ncbi:MAG: ankyrin repeat domain-containing protein, partial [Simkaniaceae bacterium]|nr:ankyrin repeat domain-containing protein [Simkaniaceae bacterium]
RIPCRVMIPIIDRASDLFYEGNPLHYMTRQQLRIELKAAQHYIKDVYEFGYRFLLNRNEQNTTPRKISNFVEKRLLVFLRNEKLFRAYAICPRAQSMIHFLLKKRDLFEITRRFLQSMSPIVSRKFQIYTHLSSSEKQFQQLTALKEVEEQFDDSDLTLIRLVRAGQLGVEALIPCELWGPQIDIPDRSGMTALIAASGANHPHIVRILIDRGANIFLRNKMGMSALSSAVQAGNHVAMRTLIWHGANIHAMDYCQMTPLSRAAQKGNAFAMTTLINLGANIDHVDKSGMTPLFRAIESGKLEAVRILTGAGADVNHVDCAGKTPLIRAIERKKPGMVELLLSRGARANFRSKGEAPILSAIKINDSDFVLLLLEHGANPNIQLAFHQTPLLYAIRNKFERIAQILIGAGARVNIADALGKTPLFHAVKAQEESVVRSLLERGAYLYMPKREESFLITRSKRVKVYRDALSLSSPNILKILKSFRCHYLALGGFPTIGIWQALPTT